jgi:hypothetical protein
MGIQRLTVLVFALLAALGFGFGALNAYHALFGNGESPPLNVIAAVVGIVFGTASAAFAAATYRGH